LDTRQTAFLSIANIHLLFTCFHFGAPVERGGLGKTLPQSTEKAAFVVVAVRSRTNATPPFIEA
jgi:hypothetical protein